MVEFTLKKFGHAESINRRYKCNHGQKKKTLVTELSVIEE